VSSDTTMTTTDGRPLTAAERALLEAYRARPMPSEEAVRRLQAVRYEARREVPPLTDGEEAMLKTVCDTVGFREALHRLTGTALPPEPRAEDPDDDQEADDQAKGQEDEDDQEQAEEPAPARPRRRQPVAKRMADKSELPIIRQSLTFNVPWDPELITIECVILANWPWNDPEAETLEPTPEARDRLESEGWHNFSAYNHECFVRVVV
jgi:hypothetical protein